jgi:parallel beta helix pectate lyase-like protein
MTVRRGKRRRWSAASVPALLLLSLPAAAGARVLDVGPGLQLKTPSAAAAVARPGDTVMIRPGRYFDCAVWNPDRLTIAGSGPGVVVTDKTCEGKALFVVRGGGITIRNITFTRARVPDGNGAGIRAEGRDLTVENSQFVNNEEGILAGDNAGSVITIRNSTFEDNGKCTSACAHGIYVGHIKELRVTGSKFRDTKMGHSVKSRALRTVLRGDEIEDGPQGTASYLVDISNGGSLIMEDNTLEKGPHSSNHSAAIVIGGEGVTQPTEELRISNNSFRNDQTMRTIFVRNLTATPAVLTGNHLSGPVEPLAGDGSVH